jgi:hypothetical protein
VRLDGFVGENGDVGVFVSGMGLDPLFLTLTSQVAMGMHCPSSPWVALGVEAEGWGRVDSFFSCACTLDGSGAHGQMPTLYCCMQA